MKIHPIPAVELSLAAPRALCSLEPSAVPASSPLSCSSGVFLDPRSYRPNGEVARHTGVVAIGGREVTAGPGLSRDRDRSWRPALNMHPRALLGGEVAPGVCGRAVRSLSRAFPRTLVPPSVAGRTAACMSPRKGSNRTESPWGLPASEEHRRGQNSRSEPPLSRVRKEREGRRERLACSRAWEARWLEALGTPARAGDGDRGATPAKSSESLLASGVLLEMDGSEAPGEPGDAGSPE